MAPKKFSTNIDHIVQTNLGAFLDGTVRDENADIVINNLGAALAAERENVKNPADARRLFMSVSGQCYHYDYSPFFYDFFVKMYEKGQQCITLSACSVLPSSMETNAAARLAYDAEKDGLVITEPSCFAIFVAPSGTLLTELADLGWADLGCTHPKINQAAAAKEAAGKPRNGR
jgi:hypothetical protein